LTMSWRILDNEFINKYEKNKKNYRCIFLSIY
jgi:hypothetical protein